MRQVGFCPFFNHIPIPRALPWAERLLVFQTDTVQGFHYLPNRLHSLCEKLMFVGDGCLIAVTYSYTLRTPFPYMSIP